jgi:hypothetical protein
MLRSPSARNPARTYHDIISSAALHRSARRRALGIAMIGGRPGTGSISFGSPPHQHRVLTVVCAVACRQQFPALRRELFHVSMLDIAERDGAVTVGVTLSAVTLGVTISLLR